MSKNPCTGFRQKFLSSMGTWGYGSDENDETYDILQLGISDRVSFDKLTAQGRQTMKRHFNKMPMQNKTPGVVVWFLKQGILVSKQAIKRAIHSLENEDTQGWVGPDKRKKEIKKEVKMLKKAIASKQAPTRMKTKGIVDTLKM